MKHVLKRWAVGLGVAAAALPLAQPRAMAAAHTYNTKVQTIRVGVLLANRGAWAGSDSGPDSPHRFSYVFEALNARPDIRPYSWEIVNPHAAPFMDDDAARRYGVTFNASNPPRLGKSMGAYWEVFLQDATTETLSDYDVLYMPFPLLDENGSGALTVQDREKLRRAVDGGAILWVDDVAGRLTAAAVAGKIIVNPAFQVLPGSATQNGDPMQSLLNTPNPLSQREIRSIGVPGLRSRILSADVDGNSGMAGWQQVMFAGGGPTAAVFPYGQGAIIVTGGAIGVQLTQGIRRGDAPNQITNTQPSTLGYLPNNTGAVSGTDARFVSASALKFTVNLISFGFQNQQQGGGPRHASGSRQDLNTPLGRKWQFPDRYSAAAFPNAGSFVSDPVVWNGIAYAATTDGKLRAYDMDPYRDLDGDGNPDDGLPNTASTSSDIIWQADLPAPCSSLTAGTVGNETFIYGMLSDGRVFRARGLKWGNVNGRRRIQGSTDINTRNVFGAFPPLLSARPGAPVPGEANVYRIPAPVWYNGRLFAVGMQQSPSADTGFGSVAEIDPGTLSVLWQFPETTKGTANISAQSRLGIPSATPTVAAIPDKGYADATDIMLLVPTLSIRPEDNMGNNQPSRVVAFPLGVRGERLLHVATDPALGSIYYTRLAGPNAPAVAPGSVRLWVQGQPNSYSGSPNIDNQRLNRLYFSSTALPAGAGDEVRADYDFAPGPPTGNFAAYGARWSFDAWRYQTGGQMLFMEILTSPVVSSEGSIYWVASDLGQGGGQAPIIYGVEMREQRITVDPSRNPTSLQQLNRPQLSFLYRIGQNQELAGGLPPITLGTPAVDRGVLYVPWGQWDGSGASRGGVAGFHVKDTQFGLLLSQPIDEAQKGKTSVFQRNMVTGLFEPVSYGLIDQQNVSIGNTLRGLLLFKSLSSGSGQSSLDLSRPGDIQVNYMAWDPTGAQSVQVTAESPTTYYKVGSREGTDSRILLAYDATVPAGGGLGTSGRAGIRTGVTVAGGSMYVGTDGGEVWTVPLPTDLEVVQNEQNPQPTYMRQATFPSLGASAGFPAGGYPADTAAALRAAPVVANNTLVVNAPVGLYTFYSPRTLITDSNRILEVATAYKPAVINGVPDYTNITLAGSAAVWSMDSTTQTRDFGRPGAGPDSPPWGGTVLARPVEKSLAQPTMAIRVNTTNTLISDTGNNRVVEVDRAGRVVWQLTEFADPYGLLGPNEPRTLSSPTSVQRWETYEYDPQDRVGARVQHTLIADFGNNRVVEVVSRYAADPNQWANNVLVWVGKGPQGSNYHFYQAQREPYFNDANANDPNNGNMDYGRTIASVTNVSVNSADADIGPPFNGAVTKQPATPGGSLVILGGREDKDTNGNSAAGKVVYFFNRMVYGTDTSTVFPLARPVYFQRYTTGAGAMNWVLLMTDGQNVFDLTPSGTPGIGQVVVSPPEYPDLFPIVGNAAAGQPANGGVGSGGYTIGTAMAKRLQNGDILMVNQQTGYVFEVSPTAALANQPLDQVLQVTAPPIEGTATLTRPVYADRIY